MLFNPPLNRIYIVGSGTTALALANVMFQSGLQPTIITPKIDFYRTGDMVQEVFYELSELIIHPVKPSTAYHIKDAEKGLFEGLARYNPSIITGEVINVKNREIILQDGRHLPYDLIFDCSGTERAVVKVFSSTDGEKFKIEKRGKSFKFCSARFIVNKQFDELTKLQRDPSTDKLIFKKMREMGWNGNEFPLFILKKGNTKKNKMNLYGEIPEDLNEEDQESLIKWVYLAIELIISDITNVKFYANPSKKHPGKNKVSCYYVNSRSLEQCFIRDSDSSLIVPLGDALMNIPFFSGSAISNHRERIQYFMDCLLINEGSIIAFDEARYKEVIQPLKEQSFADAIQYSEEHDKQEATAREFRIQTISSLVDDCIRLVPSMGLNKQQLIESILELIENFSLLDTNDAYIREQHKLRKIVAQLQTGKNINDVHIFASLIEIEFKIKEAAQYKPYPLMGEVQRSLHELDAIERSEYQFALSIWGKKITVENTSTLAFSKKG